ncbi:50S ribosomal protein L9 [Plasticicumulans acidivorans]|uniref:Large ribosomal subunit protein bL9 n=1 Tax=Plasticicumulans acidivorans TaxID=886464 RepID=A0A317MQZ2_9GAMM|nr:50S ribosomal protein L9 [Plasticicumulans acidivorans]PWV58536.1 LSU ribosomal protein L9P [Plasticicumulans acidivorans]
MEVILLTKVENLGNLGDRVTVRHGYGRNFLIPKGKATEATAANVARFEARRAELEAAAADALAKAQARRDQLADLLVTMAAKAGAEGRLFGSIGPADIADVVTAAGYELARSEVRMPEGPVRQVGEYEVDVHLHTDVNCKLHINVIAE